MNSRQKEVLKTQLSDEQKQLKMLEKIYKQASEDCAKKIAELSARTDMENLQSIIYQKQYQEAMKNQIDGLLAKLQSDSFVSISDYLGRCYENGYIGAMYDLAGQGIPLIIPIDQQQVVQAIQTDSKISKGLYKRLGEDVDYLKKSIRAELSRGITQGSSWNEIASHIANGMNSPFKKAMNSAMRITRTEGHRIQMTSQIHACQKAKGKGADIVKQWDATLDARTRDSHAKVDGEIRELDEKFSNGLRMPSDPHGAAAEVVNCRCCLLQRARWGLDEDELKTLQEKAKYFGLDKADQFDEFKKKYLTITSDIQHLLKSVSDCASYEDLRNYFEKLYDIKISQNVETLNFEKVKAAMDGVDFTIRQYPQLAKQIKGFGTDITGFMNTDGRWINFNPKYFKDATQLEFSFEAGCHEAGHCLDMILCVQKLLKEEKFLVDAWISSGMTGDALERRIQGCAKSYYWDSNSVSRGIVTRAINKIKKEHPEYKNKTAQFFRGSISDYALSSTAETIAESVAEELVALHNGGNKRTIYKFDLAKEIVTIMNEMLKGVK